VINATQPRAAWHTDSLYMMFLPSAGASRYHSCCIDGGISLEYFEYTLVCYANGSDCDPVDADVIYALKKLKRILCYSV
jgi:hypothetical protein